MMSRYAMDGLLEVKVLFGSCWIFMFLLVSVADWIWQDRPVYSPVASLVDCN